MNSIVNELLIFTLFNNPGFRVPLEVFTYYLERLLESNQLIIERNSDGAIIGYLGYFKIEHKQIDRILMESLGWFIPKDYNIGRVVFVDISVTNGKPRVMRTLIRKIYEQEPNAENYVWVDRKTSKLHYSTYIKRRELCSRTAE